MKTLRRWLIIKNYDECRVVTKNPTIGRKLHPNEVAIEIVIKAPEAPRMMATVNIELPEPPPVFAAATTVTYGEDTDEDFIAAVEKMDED